MVIDTLQKKLLVFLSVFLLILHFIGCGNHGEIKKVDLSKIEETKENQQSLRIKIGLVPEQDIRKMASRYEPLAEYLERDSFPIGLRKRMKDTL